jgi:hypothetical protein
MEFWTYVWDVVDVDTRALVSQMDVIWPQARANWSGANAAQREQIATDILQLIISVWGDEAVATASYLAGEITYDEYLPFMNVVHSRWAAGAEAGGNDVQGTAEGGAAEGGSTDDGPSIHDMISTHLGSFIVYQ